jgi:hypothetical protein
MGTREAMPVLVEQVVISVNEELLLRPFTMRVLTSTTADSTDTCGEVT